MIKELIHRPANPANPAIRALLSQFAGGICTLMCWKFVPYFSTQEPSLWILLILWGGVAAVVGSLFLALPTWWTFINALFPITVYAFDTFDLPGWIYLTAFILCLVVFWNVVGERVPLYLSNPKTWTALHDLIAGKDAVTFIDIGSGMGGTINYLGKHNPESLFKGIENAPLPYALSWLRHTFSSPSNVSCEYGDFWQQDLSEFSIVYCFLSPEPMPRLYDKAVREMKSGSLLISNSFEIPGHPPQKTFELDDTRKTKLLIWEF